MSFFDKDAARGYDERNRKLSRISDCLHFLITLMLNDLSPRARILCVGVGTGAEILSLAQAHPEWSFVGVDPSADMLAVARERIENAGFETRCELFHGFIQDLPAHDHFDAALSLLVAHFVKRDARADFFAQMTKRLRQGGHLVNAEISFDLGAPDFPAMLRGWEQVQTQMGATPESLAGLPKLLRDTLTVLSPVETESLLKTSGVERPLRFFQALMISAWHGRRA